MKFVVSTSYDPYYNLALEEYILHHLKDDTYCMIWQNNQTLVVGKYQNVFEEINIPKAYQQNIKIVRRNTGGGTVFHDKGNINISFIKDWNPDVYDTNDEFLEAMIELIAHMNIELKKANTSDLRVGEYKVSGNAQTIYKGRILHHGTLLFDSDLKKLNGVIKPLSTDIKSKSIKSNRSTVGNLKDYMTSDDIDVQAFKNLLVDLLIAKGGQAYTLNELEEQEVAKLKEEKYQQWQWNIGNSPNFEFSKKETEGEHFIEVSLSVKKGQIDICKIDGDFLDDMDKKKICDSIQGKSYDYPFIMSILEQFKDIYNEKQIELLKKSFF